MFDGSVAGNITAVVAFVEGLVSFFSPCVIPLLPIYLGYLSGNLEEEKPSRKRTLLFTMTFIIGIFTALLLLNASISWISMFFQDASAWFMRIGGICIILLGLIQLGIFKIPFLQRTFHINFSFAGKRMNLVLAFVMGFTFSFSWTPCIGPALASILIMASNAGSFLTSTFLVVVYAIGFSLPFLIISFFSKEVIQFIRKQETVMQVIVKLGAILLIIMGLMMSLGQLSILGGGGNTTTNTSDTSNNDEQDTNAAPQFTLQGQSGETISLSDYEGKVVYLNFWGTWCGVCRNELTDMKALYEKYKDSEEVAVVTVVNPGGQEQDIDGIKAFLEENEIAFPVLFDTESVVFAQYGIRSFPTVFMINKDQTIFGYLSGGIDLDTMENIIQQTMEGKMEK